MSSTNQRGKNVVSASSGNTTRSQPPRRRASRSSASSRSTTSLRVSVALDRPELGRTDGHDTVGTSCRDRSTARRPRHRPAGRGRRILRYRRTRARSRRASSARTVRSRALDGMTFTVEPGSVTGFLGPNGAGKTTTMRAIFGLTALDAGEVRWDGPRSTSTARRRFGYLPEERGLYPNMRIADQLSYLGAAARPVASRRRDDAVAGLARASSASPTASTSNLEDLSLGNQQRVQLISALIHEPDVLVLDEPFSGLDPVAVDALSKVLVGEARRGATVLFSSHQLDLVEHLCERGRHRRPRPRRRPGPDRRPHGRARSGARDRRARRPRGVVDGRPRDGPIPRRSARPTGACGCRSPTATSRAARAGSAGPRCGPGSRPGEPVRVRAPQPRRGVPRTRRPTAGPDRRSRPGRRRSDDMRVIDRSTWLVAKREITEGFRAKAFRIVLAVSAIAVAGLLVIFNLTSDSDGSVTDVVIVGAPVGVRRRPHQGGGRRHRHRHPDQQRRQQRRRSRGRRGGRRRPGRPRRWRRAAHRRAPRSRRRLEAGGHRQRPALRAGPDRGSPRRRAHRRRGGGGASRRAARRHEHPTRGGRGGSRPHEHDDRDEHPAVPHAADLRRLGCHRRHPREGVARRRGAAVDPVDAAS